MKNVLGLDLGITSIGWAFVKEAENDGEKSEIVKLGVRVNPLTVDEKANFEQGKSITTNADRTLKRSMRRNLQRYKHRREALIDILKESAIITDTEQLTEYGNRTTFQTYQFRAKAALEQIPLEAFARVLLMINKKRGYKSSRKAKNQEEGALIDGMLVAKELYEREITPGAYCYELLSKGSKYLPDFYSSDLRDELDRIWKFQQPYYPDMFTVEFRDQIQGKGKLATSKIFLGKFQIYTLDNKGKDKKINAYKLRVEALERCLTPEELAFVICEVNGAINVSSGYLGAISDRSKELFFNKQTVGQYQMALLNENPHCSLRNQVFYRQDYLDEFERIWEVQATFYPILTLELKREIRDVVIFYQRALKSQKGLISFCELEHQQREVVIDGKVKQIITGARVVPASSPLFQEFRMWQIINNLKVSGRCLTFEEKAIVMEELSVKAKLSDQEILKLLFKNPKELRLNFKEVPGHRTQAALFNVYCGMIARSGHGEYDFSQMKKDEILELTQSVFEALGYNTAILKGEIQDEQAIEQNSLYKLWHLLYSYEGDNSKTGDESLRKKLSERYGFSEDDARALSGVVFEPDYGSLSAKAIKKILPYLKEGNEYSLACEYAGYNHSALSLTREELAKKVLKDKLDVLPKNSLRNPVVEKILNQMINVVNQVVETYGKPDEIRIELARELKKNAKERQSLTEAINKTTKEHEEYKQILQNRFGLVNVGRNDIIRYKLYEELKPLGYHTIYSNTYISPDKLFTNDFDIEHIIPQSRLFDDSFSNKTLEARQINIEKSNLTAYDYVCGKYGEEGVSEYLNRIERLSKEKVGGIGKAKQNKLKMKGEDIPTDFIARDLRDSQYIAKKARLILLDLVKEVVSTTGSITDRLREDWQLVNVMRELNWDKYDKLGLTEYVEDRDGRKIPKIKEWTKRNDHRHHAMDALTIAFTKHTYIQYLNNLNAKSEKGGSIYAIEQKELYRDNRNKLLFKSPIMPVEVFRREAKSHLSSILISIKAKNKVVTRNINRSKRKGTICKKVQITPRGQLHNETVYGMIRQYLTKEMKVGGTFTQEVIATVSVKRYREALMKRLAEFDGDPKKAFTGKNAPDKNPVYVDAAKAIALPEKVKLLSFETVYTIRKEITPDLKIEKVLDVRIRNILENRLAEFGGNTRQAFSNLDEHPIWLNKEKGIAIKRVTISGISNAQALRDKRDQFGKLLLDEEGNKQPVDFVSTSNNHHVAIYRDAEGNLQENIVSFFEATERARNGYPIVDKEYKKGDGWEFLFSMKQNEYFVFPNKATEFNPSDIDLLDPANYHLISPNLFRVQAMSKVEYGNAVVRDFKFRYHLETSVNDVKLLRDVSYKQFKSLSFANEIVKVRINHIGQIVSVGEY